MAEITAALVKQLRDSTGAGMMDCKAALAETGGDLEAAADWLRKKGISRAEKKAGKTAAEGLIGLEAGGAKGVLVEVNSQTDFVARNDSFQEFVETVAQIALDTGDDVEALKTADYPGAGKPVADQLTNLIATIGENMSIRRAASLAVSPGIVASYMHNSVKPKLGKIGVLVALKSEADATKLSELGRQLAMHVAATSPKAVSTDDLDAAEVDRERDILREQALAEGKPAEIVEKMIEGRLRKFYEEVVLLNQTFVIDGETKISKVLETAGKDLGSPVEIAGFVRFALGEGIEKEEDDFAAEVAQLAG